MKFIKSIRKKLAPKIIIGGGNINDQLRQIRDELANLRRLIVMKEICPELMDHMAPQIKLPEGENGVGTYENKFKQRHRWFKDWVNDAYFQLNDTFWQYPNKSFVLEEHLKRTEFLIENDADHLAFYSLVFPLMASRSKQEFAKDYFDRFIQGSNLEKFVGNKYHWQRLITYYLDREDEENASNLLSRYRKKFGEAEIAAWLPIADLAFRTGSKKYSLQSAIFQELVKNTKEYPLERLFGYKKIALVGSGPQEKGKGLGEYIDSFDFVIRMNSYNLTPKYIKDYGSKCDLRYRIVEETDEEEAHFNRGNPHYSFLSCPPWWFPYRDELLKRYAANIESGQILRPYTYPEMRYVREACGVSSPSGGLILITLIHKVNPNFTQSNCFGFSFKEEGKVVWSHYDGSVVRHPVHNLACEREIIQIMLAP